jgi:diadenylate cyclase
MAWLLAAFPWDDLRRLDARAALDILLIAAVIYYFLNLLRGTRAAQMAVALGLIAVAYYTARWARLEMVEWLLTTLIPYLAIALIILFQPEIRAALASAGRNPFWRIFSGQNPIEAHDDIVLAVRHFAQHRIGALVVLEREVGLKTYVESGIPLDAQVSYDLLLSIFHPASPLHDGAAIIQGTRVAAAACFLPLSLNPAISTQLGTRHRAAIGVTEESDAIVVLVSEQTGAIALAADGNMERNLTPEQLSERLAALFVRYRPPVALPAPAAGTRAEAANEGRE